MRQSIHPRAAGAVLVIVAAASAATARADEPSAIAEALFRSGRELMAAEKYAEACPKFAESERVDPKPGTLLNLALCHEKTNKSASAWAEYLEAAETARRAGESARERVARDRAAALEPTLPHVTIEVDAASTAQVVLDDRVLGPGAFGTPIPIDPGEHMLLAVAPGRKPFSQAFSVAVDAEPSLLRIPPLEPEVAAPPAVLPPVVNDGAVHRRGRAVTAKAIGGIVSDGAGLALIGIGAFFGARAFAEKHTAESDCDATVCTSGGLDAIQSMKTAEAVSTLSIGAGVVAIGSGIYLLVSSPSHKAPSASTLRIGPDVALRGARMSVSW